MNPAGRVQDAISSGKEPNRLYQFAGIYIISVPYYHNWFLKGVAITFRRRHEKTSYESKAKLCGGMKKLFPMINLNWKWILEA